MPDAAAGSRNGRPGRPAVSLKANVMSTRIRPTSRSTLLRCQRAGRNRQSQTRNTPINRLTRIRSPANRARSSAGLFRPNATIFSMSSGVIRCPPSTITSPCWISSVTGATAWAAATRVSSVFAWLNEELGTSSPEISSVASSRCSRPRPPAIRVGREARVVATSESRSSARSNWSRTCAASPRTTFHSAGVRASRVLPAGSDNVGTTGFSSVARLAALTPAAKAASIGSTALANADACSAATAAASACV